MPTAQEGVLTNAARVPGYHGFFTGTDLRSTGTATAELNRKTLPYPTRYTDTFGDRTSIYNPLSDFPGYKAKMNMDRKTSAFDRNLGIPRYNTFNVTDWSETKPITANDDKDRFDILARRAAINNKDPPIPKPTHLNKPVPLYKMFTHSNFDQYRTKKILPLPGESDYAAHMFKVWDVTRPTFVQDEGVFRHKMWGVQQEDGTGLLDYRKGWMDNTRLYPRQEEYRKMVEDKRKTAGAVLAVKPVEYDTPSSCHYRPKHVTQEVNPVQTQMRSIYRHGNIWTVPHTYVGPPLFF